MYSFKVKRIYLFGDANPDEFEEWWEGHTIVTPRSISDDHFSPAASYQDKLSGAVYAFDGELTQQAQLDVVWCYRNGVPLVVWDKTDGAVSPWLRWHALGVFTSKEQAVKILLTSLGLFEQA
jgi:hypothetical protein